MEVRIICQSACAEYLFFAIKVSLTDIGHLFINTYMIMSIGKTLSGLLLTPALCLSTFAQNSWQTIPLNDMSAFKPQAGNWRVAGDVTIDPFVDIHPPAQPEAETGKKEKRAKNAPATEHPKAVVYEAGNGILLNLNDDITKDHLVTAFEHGDIELELEVMIPKGSNSGIYLQGRYELQLLDSWGVKNPRYGDIGGIYRNWETEPSKIYMGKAPLSNPAKAPGLWQTMKISFRAPRFDANGKKTANARFVYVGLNGVRIHNNVEVPLPTGGPLENNEVALGPLMIQGDHGPVAFRNIRYKLLKEVTASLSDISYQTYYGNFKTISDFSSLKPDGSGSIPELTCEVLEKEDGYGTIYRGDLTVSDKGDFKFILAYTGGARLVINNQQLTNFQSGDGWWRNDEATVTLEAGTYPFEIYNYKAAAWLAPRLGFFIESAGTPKPLHAFNSFPPADRPVSPIYVEAGSEPRLLRAFLDFKGDYKQRLTHTIGVADPSGTNYVYDLKSGNLSCVWRGSFVDATPMWHDRGDGSFRPQGAVQYLFNNQPIAFLSGGSEPFPVMAQETQLSNTSYQGKGYSIEQDSGRPVFQYLYDNIEVEDKVYPADEGRSLTHEITLNNRGTKPGLYYKIAEGSSIVKMPNGLYAVDDKTYFVKIDAGQQPTVREVNGRKELIVQVGSAVKYTLIW